MSLKAGGNRSGTLAEEAFEGSKGQDIRLAMYAPEDGGVNDHCLVRADDGWHYYFIYREYEKPDSILPPQESKLGHAFSKDLFHWKTCNTPLRVVPETWESKFVWAPYVIKRGTYWYMFYVGADESDVQRLGVVRSKDLYNWERFTDKPVLDAWKFSWYAKNVGNMHDCRDPYVIQHGKYYYLYYTSRAQNDIPCIAAARSTDLIHWKDMGPVLTHIYPILNEGCRDPLESCCVFERNGLWYLVYQYQGIRYHVSRNPLDWHDTMANTFSTKMWLFRWADIQKNIFIYKTECFYGVLRFGIVKWDKWRMFPDNSMHGTNRSNLP